MNFWDNWKDAKWLPNTIAVCSGVVLYLALTHISMLGVFFGSIWKLASPLVIGVVLAYILDPIVRFFESKGVKRNMAVWLMLACVIGAVLLLLVLVVPQLIAGVLQFVDNISSYVKGLENSIQAMELPNMTDMSNISEQVGKLVDTVTSWITSGSVIDKSSGIGTSVASFGISSILAIYYLLSKATLVSWVRELLKHLLKEERYAKLASFCSRCNDILLRYISCSLVEALIVGLTNAVFMAVAGMPFISVISCIVGLTNLAPTFGPIVGCVMGMFILLLVSPQYVIAFLIFTLVLQTVDGYVIKPKLFGNTLGVSALLILIFLVLGGRLFGILGILVAIPAAAIFQYLFTEILFPNHAQVMAAEAAGTLNTEKTEKTSPAVHEAAQVRIAALFGSLKGKIKPDVLPFGKDKEEASDQGKDEDQHGQPESEE